MKWTIAHLLQWTTDYFKNRGIRTPRLDAEVLLAHVLKIERVDLYINFDKPIEAEERDIYRAMVRRRALREPVAYIIGRKEFYSLTFTVNQSVLIPRPETELLVEHSLVHAQTMVDRGTSPRILDIGTGSGAIILTIAARIPQADCVGLDIALPALDVARQNAAVLGLVGRVIFLEADTFPLLGAGSKPYDIIVANPPYIRSDALETLEPEIRLYEPRRALDGGRDGLDCYRKIVAGSFKNLSKIGILLLEVDDLVAADVMGLLEHTGRFDDIHCYRDLAGQQRVVSAYRKD